MAEVTGMRNNALPYPVYGAPWAVTFPMLDADGDLVTGATTPDAERSLNGDTFADCTNESVEIATNSGVYYLLLTGAEMTADIVTVIAKSATAGMKTTVLTFYPRKLVALRAGTAAGGAAGSITLDAGASAVDDFYNGCLVVGVLDSATEARIITDYTGSTKVAAVTPNWNTTPDSDDTFTVYLPEGRQIEQANVTHVAETAQTAGDLKASLNTIDDFIDAEVAAIVTALGTAGAGLTAVPWNAAWDAEVQSEVADALAVYDPPTNTEMEARTIAAATYATAAALDAVDNFLDTEIGAIKAVTDALPDAGALTSLATAAAVDTIDNFLDTEVAAIKAVTDALPNAGALTSLATQASVNTIDDFLDTELAALIATVGAAGAGLSAVPWNAAWDAEVQSEATDALNAYDPPTRAEATTDVNSVIAMLTGITPVNGTIGATGNDTTHLHLAGLAYADDGVNSMLITVKDVSTGLFYSRWIEDFANTGDLATVSTLPFTPEASVDLYWILPVRADVTGGSGLDAAGVRAAIGLASANLDTQLTAIDDLIDTEVATLTTRLGTPSDLGGGASIAANLADIEAQTDDIGTAGAGLTALATAAALDTVDNFLDTEIAAIKLKTDLIPGTIDGKTFSELVTLIAAVLLGKASGLETTTAVYRAVDDSKARVTATVTSDGNRSALTLDAT